MKKILLQTLFICIFAHLHICTFAQDSSRIRISLLTCTPGEELYATFGHSALRIIDSNSVTDHVYNFGTFNFNDKGFYLKFIKGQLKYYVNVEAFDDFNYSYAAENRGITEQVLIFSAEEKIAIHRALIENIKEENKFYMYDFFFDNCTTRLRDIIVKFHHPLPALPAVMPTTFTFRNAIHQYLNFNNKPWSKLGIDILLGAPTDAVMTVPHQQFLPENLMKSLDSVSNTKIVAQSKNLFLLDAVNPSKNLFTPFVFFSSILLFFIIISFLKAKNAIYFLKGMDAFLFFTIGLLGVVLVLMWVATDHLMTKNNYNLLWAWPIHIVYAFVMNKNTRMVKMFSMLIALFLLLLLCCWAFLPQQMNNALLPLVFLMIWRSSLRFFKAT